MSNKKEKLLIFGGSGQIGSRAKILLSKKYKLITPSHQQVDITNRSEVENFIRASKPNQILYSVGFTSIDKGPEQPKEAFMLNAGAIYYITSFVQKRDIPVRYLSTEVVFNGKKKDSPYTEEDQPDPMSFLAQTKRTGELATLSGSPKNSVIRLIICYSASYEQKLDIARMVVKNLREENVFTSTRDQEINPIYVDHLIGALSLIIDNRASGIYHVGAKDYTTPYEFCKKIAKSLGLDTKLVKSTTFNKFSKTRPEPRPQHEWLDVSKFIKDFGKDSLFTVDEGIEAFKVGYLRLTSTSISA